MTNLCLSQHCTSFVVTKVCLSQQNICCNEILFCRNKRVCCDKRLVSAGILLSQQRMCFVLVVLLQQNYVCCCKTFVMTKMTLVAAPANDRYGVKG